MNFFDTSVNIDRDILRKERVYPDISLIANTMYTGELPNASIAELKLITFNIHEVRAPKSSEIFNLRTMLSTGEAYTYRNDLHGVIIPARTISVAPTIQSTAQTIIIPALDLSEFMLIPSFSIEYNIQKTADRMFEFSLISNLNCLLTQVAFIDDFTAL